MAEGKIYINELAHTLNRRENTIRKWTRRKDFPRGLKPKREKTESGEGWRYWTPEQVEGIERWMVEKRMFPGAGLTNFDPTPEAVQELQQQLRGRGQKAA